jgi:hypothetical protein
MARLLFYQWVYGSELRKTAEIAVGSPQLAYAVLYAQCSNPCVMDLWSGNARRPKKTAQLAPVRIRLGKERESGRFQPCFDLIDSLACGRGWGEDARMRSNCVELVQAWPWDAPWASAFGECPDSGGGFVVKGSVLAMSVKENIRVDGDQSPRPS